MSKTGNEQCGHRIHATGSYLVEASCSADIHMFTPPTNLHDSTTSWVTKDASKSMHAALEAVAQV